MSRIIAKIVLIALIITAWRILCGLDSTAIDKIFRLWLAVQVVAVPLNFIGTKGDNK